MHSGVCGHAPVTGFEDSKRQERFFFFSQSGNEVLDAWLPSISVSLAIRGDECGWLAHQYETLDRAKSPEPSSECSSLCQNNKLSMTRCKEAWKYEEEERERRSHKLRRRDINRVTRGTSFFCPCSRLLEGGINSVRVFFPVILLAGS